MIGQIGRIADRTGNAIGGDDDMHSRALRSVPGEGGAWAKTLVVRMGKDT